VQFAGRVNEQAEDFGARRLHTIMEKVLDEISFNATDLEAKRQVVDAACVQSTLTEIVKDQDPSRYIL
jgi:ATP-dependent HslUV protease ATP-binding subunit HslU